jgi:hypothetical protein
MKIVDNVKDLLTEVLLKRLTKNVDPNDAAPVTWCPAKFSSEAPSKGHSPSKRGFGCFCACLSSLTRRL